MVTRQLSIPLNADNRMRLRDLYRQEGQTDDEVVAAVLASSDGRDYGLNRQDVTNIRAKNIDSATWKLDERDAVSVHYAVRLWPSVKLQCACVLCRLDAAVRRVRRLEFLKTLNSKRVSCHLVTHKYVRRHCAPAASWWTTDHSVQGLCKTHSRQCKLDNSCCLYDESSSNLRCDTDQLGSVRLQPVKCCHCMLMLRQCCSG